MSLQITITPKERAAGRFVSRVRRAIQKALAEEFAKRGTTQSSIARAIGVNRSVISREIRGHKDLSLSRVAEIAWALGRRPAFDLLNDDVVARGANVAPLAGAAIPVLPQSTQGQPIGLPAKPGQSAFSSQFPAELKAILPSMATTGNAA
jgi:transcriptional regulator with XRE-family HTH domain